MAYLIFITAALILMVAVAEWGVKRDRKQYKQYRNGRIERWKI